MTAFHESHCRSFDGLACDCPASAGLDPSRIAEWDMAMGIITKPGPAAKWLAEQTPVIEKWKAEDDDAYNAPSQGVGRG